MPGRRWPGTRDHLPPKWTPSLAGCALDVVDANPDGLTARQVGDAIGVTEERVRQIVDKATAKMRVAGLEW